MTEWIDDDLWGSLAVMIPPQHARTQGGGRRRYDERTMLAAILYRETIGASWRETARTFDVWPGTAHRHFARWKRQRKWKRIYQHACALIGDGEIAQWAETVRATHDASRNGRAAAPPRLAARPRPPAG